MTPPQHPLRRTLSSHISKILSPLNIIYNYLQSDVSKVGFQSASSATGSQMHTYKKMRTKKKNEIMSGMWNKLEIRVGGQEIYGGVMLTEGDCTTAQGRKNSQ